MDIIRRGAEATIYLSNNMLIKERIKKSYRIPEIDEELRKKRTRQEANLLIKAKRAGISTPKVFDVEKYIIKMEIIDGIRMKEFINKADNKSIEDVSYKIGRKIGILHNRGIVHGDLTTSNIIYKDENIYFIDFGLGFFTNRTEDFGTDLIVLKEAIKSTHFKHLNIILKNILKGYSTTNNAFDKIFKVMDEIEKRGRYTKG